MKNINRKMLKNDYTKLFSYSLTKVCGLRKQTAYLAVWTKKAKP